MQFFDHNDREFCAPDAGGFVHEITPSRPGLSGPQVCRRLRHIGATISCGPGGLERVILREARSRRARASNSRDGRYVGDVVPSSGEFNDCSYEVDLTDPLD